MADSETSEEQKRPSDEPLEPAAETEAPSNQEPSPADKDKEKEKEKGDAARRRAMSTNRKRRDIRTSRALDDALGSLHGIKANTVIIGDAWVGTLNGRDGYGAAPGGRTAVPSGQVPSALLTKLAETFVPPAVFEGARQRIRVEPLLLLRAPRGWGRTTTALRLLAEESTSGVHKLNPDVEIRSLEIEFKKDAGYLLELLDLEQIRTLHVYHLEQLSRTLVEHGSRLIVVLDSAAELSPDLDSFLQDGGDPPAVVELVRSHLRPQLPAGSMAVLERAGVVSLLQYVAEDRPAAQQLARLAGELARVARGEIDIAEVADGYSAVVDTRFRAWFDGLDTETRAFAIALAVFNQMPLHIVSGAGWRLAQRLTFEETAGDEEPARSLFGVRSSEVLGRIGAQLYASEEETDYGIIPVEAARYIDRGTPLRVLEYVWREYHAAHELVREWLRALGAHQHDRVSTRVGVAVGLLSTFEFEHARQLVIEKWADSGEEYARNAATGALEYAALEPGLAPIVLRLLRDWSQGDQRVERRATAAAALGGAIGRLAPDRAIELLRKAVRDGEEQILDAVSYSLVQLFAAPELAGQVLGELRRWIDSERIMVRGAGFHCLLVLSFDFDIDPPNGTLPWPGLVWLAHEAPGHRPAVVGLFASLMEAPYFRPGAFREIRRWVLIAEKDPEFIGPLGRMLSSLCTATGDEADVRGFLEELADRRHGPARAVAALLAVLDTTEKK